MKLLPTNPLLHECFMTGHRDDLTNRDEPSANGSGAPTRTPPPDPAYAATIGTVVPVLGTAQDLIYDPARNLVYIANFSRSEVDIYDVAARRLTGSVPVGVLPGSLALSPDLNTLYVANLGSNTVSAVNLNTRQLGAEYNFGV